MPRDDDTAIGSLNNEPSTPDLSRHNEVMHFKGISEHTRDMAQVIVVDYDTHGIVVKDRYAPSGRRLMADDVNRLRGTDHVLVVHHSLVIDDPSRSGEKS